MKPNANCVLWFLEGVVATVAIIILGATEMRYEETKINKYLWSYRKNLTYKPVRIIVSLVGFILLLQEWFLIIW